MKNTKQPTPKKRGRKPGSKNKPKTKEGQQALEEIQQVKTAITTDIDDIGKIMANSFEDMQKIRIGTMHQIRNLIRRKAENIPTGTVEEKKEEKDYDKKYKDENLPTILKQLVKDNKLTADEQKYLEKCLTINLESSKLENKYKTAMEAYVSQKRIYTDFLYHVKGIGPVLSANLIKSLGDCSKFDTVARLWSYTGNSTTAGRAPRKVAGQKLGFNPHLRTLTWKLSDCLMKANKGIYRQVYDTTKEGLQNRVYQPNELFEKYGKPYKPEDTQLNKAHIHAMALRKMRKLFLAHYWEAARTLAGLPLREAYAEEKLGHKDIIHWDKALRLEN